MEIKITAKQMELTSALKDYVETRFSRIDKFKENFTIADVHLDSEKHKQRVSANLRGKNPYFSEAVETENMYKAIDQCVDKLEKQIRRSKHSHDRTRISVEDPADS